MTRSDVGFVASRALAVFLLVTGVRQIESLVFLLQNLKGVTPASPMPWMSFVSVGFTLALACTLWFSADRFGGTGGATGGSSLSRKGLAQVFFATLGVWLFSNALAEFLTFAYFSSAITTYRPDPPVWVSALVRGIIGAGLFVMGDGFGILRTILPGRREPHYEE